MEFSFATHQWLPIERLHEKQEGASGYALGLHAPGFFDKVLNIDKCLLQSEPANRVCCYPSFHEIAFCEVSTYAVVLLLITFHLKFSWGCLISSFFFPSK